MTDDELALQRDLDEELNRLQPRPVPTEAVYGRARELRRTRRMWAAGVLATAAVVGTSLPILGSMGLRQNAAGGGQAVTVNTPHTDKKGRYVFSGSEEGKRWSTTVAPGDCPSSGSFNLNVACNASSGSDPAELSYAAPAGLPTTYAIYFRSDIARIDMTLSDGGQATLVPGIVRGNRVALVVIPPKIEITRVDVFAADGSPVGFSIPFQADGMAHLAMWYQPGQTPTQPEASGTITGITQKGEHASVGVRIGPFGICYTVAQRSTPGAVPITNCRPFSAAASDDVPPNPPDWVALGGLVDDRVDHVDFALTTGTIRVQTVRIGAYSFAVGFADYSFTSLGETAYDASGHVIDREQTPSKS
ncbi:hypothetical protein Caci_0124 [Catenulispora acidiphila DSM 44928]|uniref:Uncharacterized protein n=1 Tax=Catenulispora acidiphila (strain DSM 44928 / JCM 14897 / NBRC 102108 / NRRL B-24433 / ID139908) TaxID=479433 RepID=C7QHE0_CATAD|nr:hypothetical protein [Catenulispora acidiphila]ACU69079.1 hypothetical protein Caci_0124 [Catenulispora acidiphila DSM 44928]